MNWAADCAVLIPCLNEAGAIWSLVSAARRQVPTVFVVDDGSRDDTALRARQAGAEVLRHDLPRGKGAALHTGWRHAGRRGFEWCLTMDGDGQHSPEDIPTFFYCAEATSAQLVVGNRMANPGRMPLLRQWVNHWMSRRLSQLAGCPFPDSQCGFRLIHLDSLSQLTISTNHFEIESEVLLGFARDGFRVQFVPIRAVYRTERSKIQPLTDTIRWFRWWQQARRQPGTRNLQLPELSRQIAGRNGL
jgi:glycosyltransferase involved in cell wall biosynthesis